MNKEATVAIPRFRVRLCFFVVATLVSASSDSLNAQWTALPSIGNTKVPSITAVNDALFAATYDSLIYKSTDFGDSWSRSSDGIPDGMNAYMLTYNGTHLYALFSPTGVYRSSDNGTTWEGINSGLTAPYLNRIASIDGNVYVGAAAGLFVQTDTGWQLASEGLLYEVYSFAKSGDRWYIGTNSRGLYRAADTNLNWVRIDTGFSKGVTVSLFVHNNYILASHQPDGLFRSTDDGESWSLVTGDIAKGKNIQAFIRVGDAIFAGSQYGVFRSTDFGATWVQMNTGLSQSSNTLVYGMCVAGDYMFLATTNHGLWRRPLVELLPQSGVEAQTGGISTQLGQNVPNPVASTAEITYTTAQEGSVTLKLYTGLAEEISILVDEPKEAGTYRVRLDASHLPSGIYYYRLTAGAMSLTRRLVVVR